MIVEDYFFIAPDWQYDMSIGRRWQTNILTSIDKSEQRATLRSYPVKVHSFVVVPFTASEYNYVNRKLYRARDKKFGVPIWTDRCQTTQDVDSGTGVTFTVNDNSNRMFEVGGLLVFLEDENNYEVKVISAIGSNQFTMDSAVVGEWDSGTDIYPILQGRFLTTHNMHPITTYGYAPLSVEVIEDFDSAITRSVLSGSSFSSYCGLPVFNLEPERSTDIQNMFEVFPNVTQFLGKSLDYSYTNEAIIKSKYFYRFYSRSEAYELFTFFDEQRGRWGNFWYPSWNDDIVLTAPFSSADTVLEIEDIEWEDYWLPNDAAGRFLYVLLPDGTEILRRIKSAPSSTELEVDAAMGTTITSTDRVLASFLYMGRFDKDEIRMKYLSESIIETQIELATISDAGISTTTTT